MCGIAGIVDVHHSRLGTGLAGVGPDAEALRAMVAALRHRGPDAEGILVDGSCGLGHTRLSIIDIEGGAQPMSIDDGDLAITFNGEIFNYLELRNDLEKRGRVFKTRSDTEVILHAYAEWGAACLEKMN